MKQYGFLFLTLLAGLLITQSLYAQDGIAPADQPLEISAQDNFQWDQANSRYIANGAVIVTQGTYQLTADEVIATYPAGGEASDLQTITATGNVTMKDGETTVTGAEAVYDVVKEIITVSGNNPVLSTATQNVKAGDTLTYNLQSGAARATGGVTLKDADYTLTAQTIDALIKTDSEAQGQNALQSATATGNVRFTNGEEIMTGQRAVYDEMAQTVTLTGNVVLTQGPNRLKGDKAVMNLTTKVSRLDAGRNGRVTGVFFPENTNANNQGAAAP